MKPIDTTGATRIEWSVWDEDDGGEKDACTVHAVDAQEAAEKYAEWIDSQGDYTIVGGSNVTLSVRQVGATCVYRFLVLGESVATYTAQHITDAD